MPTSAARLLFLVLHVLGLLMVCEMDGRLRDGEGIAELQ